ncbi:MAG: ERAP1-like C-terminal domain-containing protein, partial [Actinomycetota bacterium]|nr:ERAP1-like C-terminal domain-containing protein [Actinomycetota bacterium]
LRTDPTAAGQRQAAAARAARPTAQAKAEAWAEIVESDQLPNAVQAAMIGGFQQSDQLELMASYVEPYFAAIGDVWERRTAEMAQSVVVGLYPALLVSPETLERTDDYLQTAGPPAALRRLLLEGRDGVARALRARARDAAAGGSAGG